MNNKDNYKSAVKQIHASEELKEKAFENARYAVPNKYSKVKFLNTCAAGLVLFLIGINYFNSDIETDKTNIAEKTENKVKQEILIADEKLPRFESMEQLKSVISANSRSFYGYNKEFAEFDSIDSVATNGAIKKDIATTEESTIQDLASDFSTTNIQVENVDEADIVKTDGEYIYYVSSGVLYIVDAENLEIVSTIKIKTDNESFTISEIYLKDNKVVLLGNGYILSESTVNTEEKQTIDTVIRVNTLQTARAIIYDITDKLSPQKLREVSLEGNYLDSRMVGDNLYLISRKYAYFYDYVEDSTILPAIKDSAVTEELKRVECTDIIYFKGTNDTSFMIIGGFNINENEEVHVETFFGAGSTVYANEKNLYLTQAVYDGEDTTTIYKFGLEDAKIKFLTKGKVEGTLKNQFSMDEFEGNLRLATTSYNVVEPKKTEEFDGESEMITLEEIKTTNNLVILNENLEEIGKIENLAENEQIYSVRFIGKVGYVVTFKEIDPLFVIDLSDPTTPTIKGELKIPGYSSYLHPYDENHIIGIGYNTEDNGYGGTINTSMKMSMFDVSVLEDPQEIFSVDIGNVYTSSEIINNHKALFYKKSENLIGFPVTYSDYRYRNTQNGFIIFKIDLDNNKFEKHGEILNKLDYKTDVRRVIYIEDVLYTLGYSTIISYDLNTFEKINEVELTEEEVYEILID